MIAIHNPRLYLFVWTIILPNLLFSQTTISGKIVDADSKEPISFVNIGIKAIANGTVSDENGAYQLSLTNQVGASEIVTISAIGYETREIPLEALKKEPTIYLEARSYNIQDIELSARKWSSKTVTIGNNTQKRKQSIGFANSQLGTEIGGLLPIDKETWIKSAHFVVNRGSQDSLLFRLNIYAYQDGKIGENILQENILLSAPTKKGLLSIDLEKYNVVAQQDVLLSLQWIKAVEGKGELLIAFNAEKAGRKTNLFLKPASVSDFSLISDAFPGAPKYELCFYIVGQQVE